MHPCWPSSEHACWTIVLCSARRSPPNPAPAADPERSRQSAQPAGSGGTVAAARAWPGCLGPGSGGTPSRGGQRGGGPAGVGDTKRRGEYLSRSCASGAPRTLHVHPTGSHALNDTPSTLLTPHLAVRSRRAPQVPPPGLVPWATPSPFGPVPFPLPSLDSRAIESAPPPTSSGGGAQGGR